MGDYTQARSHNYLCVESGSSYLPYYSASGKLIICSDERFVLDLHKFLSTSTSLSLLKDVWVNEFDQGRNVRYAIALLQTTNIRSALRSTAFKSWTEVARYYCLLAQSGFSYHFRRRKLVMEFNNPIPPPFEQIREWQAGLQTKDLIYHNSGLKNFPISLVDDNTIIYLHVPAQPAQYGCGCVWNKRKVDLVKKQVCELAELGYKVCVSTAGHKWGHEIPFTKDLLPARLFTSRTYYELKAPSKYGLNNRNSEVFYCANF
jgi:hypothetical protein